MFLQIWDLKILYPFLDSMDMIRMSMVSASTQKSTDWELYFYMICGVRPLQPVSKKILYYGRFIKNEMSRYNKQDWYYVKSSSPWQNHRKKSTNWKGWFSRLFCRNRVYDYYFIYPSGLVMRNIYYFEVCFRSDLDDPSRCVSFGFTTSGDEFHQLRQNQLMIGWTPNSIGWHSDDGFIFWQNERMLWPPVRYKKNDVLGCGYDYETQDVFFSMNGREIYRQFIPTMRKDAIISCICMDHPFYFDVNFGQGPFLFQGACS